MPACCLHDLHEPDDNAHFSHRRDIMRVLLVSRRDSRDRQFKGGDDGFRSAGRSDQCDPRLVGDEGEESARAADRARPRRSAVWCSTTQMQQKRLPKAVYQALRRTITHGEALDPSVADAVATAVKDWAVEHGATHYTHWFQPLTGITAEKHDSFLTRPATARRSPSSRARSWSRASPTRRASRRAACAPPSKRAATRRGIRPARRGCSRAAAR